MMDVLGPHISQLEPPRSYSAKGEVREWRDVGPRDMEMTLHLSRRLEMSGPGQYLEFLAVPFGEAQIQLPDGTLGHGVLGTPIYVAHG
jgi:hypothetical protein